MNLRKQFFIVLILGALAGGAWLVVGPASEAALAGRGGGMPGQGRPYGAGGAGQAVLVATAEVVRTSGQTEVRAIGSGRAVQAVTLYPQVSGLVEEVLFHTGDHVDAGAVLVRLDRREQEIAVERARIALQTAERALERQQRLTESRASTSVQLQDAEAALATAQSDLAAAELALSRRTIIAPFAGVMGLSAISPGDMVSTSTEIATIDDRSSIDVQFHLAERHIGALRVGQAVQASTAAYGSETFEGVISHLDSRVDENSRTVRVRAHIANDDDRLRPGMSFALTLRLPGAEQLAVPQLAVQWSRSGPYVWTVTDGKVARTNVAIVARQGDLALVTGVKPTDIVVVEGVQSLRDGVEIATVTAQRGDL